MYKGPMDMDNRVGIDCGGRGAVGRSGESNVGKIGTTNRKTIQKINRLCFLEQFQVYRKTGLRVETSHTESLIPHP